MRDLNRQISENLLPCVRHPVQYVGLEVNAFRADVQAAEVRVAMAFPDAYSVGISHLGSQILYHMLNRMSGVACDRAYCPQPDAEARMRSEGIPLFGWESRCALADFDIIGFSLPYELCATNVLTMLDLAGLPLRSADRNQSHPLVIGGDALADSPEPMADFFDVFIVGDGEAPLATLVELVRRAKREGWPREQLLLEIARTVPPTYVPRFYEPVEVPGSPVRAVRRIRDDVPAAIQRAHLPKLTDSPAIYAPLVPLAEGVHERVVIEIMRGCPNGCRFCQAGHTRLPVRMRSVEEILEIARRGIASTGFDEVSLLSLSTGDYPHIEELIERLNAELGPKNVGVSLPSLRVDRDLHLLPKLAAAVRKGGLTVAAEAGSERMRQAIGKNIREEHILDGVRAAWGAGWRKVKVYFMAGLPGETEADIDAIADLCKRLSMTAKEVAGQPGAIGGSVSWFVPKPHTPMQWSPMAGAEYFWSVRKRLRELANRTAVSFRFHRIERSLLEGLIARGDRRVGAVIEQAWRDGARMDSWDESFRYELWTQACQRTGVDAAAIAHAAFPTDLPLPWSHIAGPRSMEYLLAQNAKMHGLLKA